MSFRRNRWARAPLRGTTSAGLGFPGKNFSRRTHEFPDRARGVALSPRDSNLEARIRFIERDNRDAARTVRLREGAGNA
jgi:hypothetical protein